MKLFYSPGTCSLAVHIALRETGLPFDLIKVDIATHKAVDGGNFFAVNPKGSVPVLELDDGARLTEGPVISQYICDLAGARTLMPAAGSLARYRVMEWQNYITSELHKFFWPLFHLGVEHELTKNIYRKKLAEKFSFVSSCLDGNSYLTGDQFSVADAYLFVVIRWCSLVGVDLKDAKNLKQYAERVSARPAVAQALLAEGLIAKEAEVAPA